MKKNIMVVIQNGMENFSSSEKRIANFITEHYKDIIYMSTMQVARACEVSDATLIRFCKKLQLSGFKDLKVKLSVDLSQIKQTLDVENIHETISVNDTIEDMFKKITYGNTKALNDTVSIIDPKELEKAVLAISGAKTVHLIGVGGSAVVAMDFYYKLIRININAFFELDFHMQLVRSAFACEGDVVVGISNSGRTKEVLGIMESSRQRGATTIAMTQYDMSPICKYSDIILFNSTTENNMRVGAMSSRITQLNIADTLFVGILAQDYAKHKIHLQQTRELFPPK